MCSDVRIQQEIKNTFCWETCLNIAISTDWKWASLCRVKWDNPPWMDTKLAAPRQVIFFKKRQNNLHSKEKKMDFLTVCSLISGWKWVNGSFCKWIHRSLPADSTFFFFSVEMGLWYHLLKAFWTWKESYGGFYSRILHCSTCLLRRETVPTLNIHTAVQIQKRILVWHSGPALPRCTEQTHCDEGNISPIPNHFRWEVEHHNKMKMMW